MYIPYIHYMYYYLILYKYEDTQVTERQLLVIVGEFLSPEFKILR